MAHTKTPWSVRIGGHNAVPTHIVRDYRDKQNRTCRDIPKPEAIKGLVEALKKLDSWLVCAGITTAEDMAQSFEQMQKIVSVALAEAGIE